MQPTLPLTRDLLLIGGGHAHALVLRKWGMNPLPGVRLTVINPGPTAPYTGMLPGHVAGHYSRDDLDIDLVQLARFAGAALIDGAATALDPVARVVTVPGRAPIGYDVASIDVGIHAQMPGLPGFAEHGTGAKPLGIFADRWRAFRAAVAKGEVAPEVAVIGGGVAGVELAMAMAHALRADGHSPSVTVIETARALTGTGAEARRRLRAAMDGLGIALRAPAKVARVEADAVVLEDGSRISARFVTGAAGARPHRWLAETPGLPVKDGFVRVDSRLRVKGFETLFAVGDCAHMSHAPRPKAGVFAVRQAPVLHANLRATLMGMGGLKPYQPQKTYLKLISLGEKAALAEKGGLTVSGRWLWRLKDKIDRDFMDQFKDLPRMPVPDLPREIAQGAREERKPLCGGCGSKVGGGALGKALSHLPPAARADVLSRPGDDAAVLEVGGQRQVLTTDHLRAFTADPDLFARIATVHALGDVWAMGAAPQAALVNLILPRLSEALQARSLDQVLTAVESVLRAAGADLVGGHTTMGAEMTLGVTITGLSAASPIGHDGARAGDALLLTKPLGTGALLVAEMAGTARGRDVMDMLHAMARPQGAAAAILSGAHAMTDVTGFGLAGHLTAICRASGVGARLKLDAIPVYAGALEAVERGHRSVLHRVNRRDAPILAAGEHPVLPLLHDPQTAGGLLAAVAAGEAEDLLARLRSEGFAAARIGTLTRDAGHITAG